MPTVTDQNLLFGVLALQAGLLDVAQFGDACSAWATRIDAVLADLLVERGWLTTDDRVEVERLLERKLRKQGSQVVADESAHPLSGSSPLGPSSRRQTTSAPPPARGATSHYIAALPASGYERSNLHATGGMGQIWQAHDHNLDREVAIKDLRPELADDPQIRERFVREARLMGQLSHPGIVPIHLVGEDERGTPYYVMKFVHGRTLEDAITAYHQQPTPLAFRDLLRHFGDVCQTIAFAHTQGMIHRDLKPRNIMLGDFGETLVLDWGLAKRLEPGGSARSVLETPTADQGLTQAGQILGTPAYISPEQTNGHPAGPLTDIYALGVILYEILVGRCPYQGTDTLEVLLQVRKGQMTTPSRMRDDIPQGLEAVCLKAMAARPGDRYQTAADLASAVENWLADELVRSEAALRESERRFRAIFDQTYQFTGLLAPDGTLLEANRTALDFAGLSRDEVVGRPFWEARWWTLMPETQQRLQTAVAEAATGQFVRYEVDVRGAGDAVATIDFSLKPIADEAGRIVLLIPEGRDITQRKRAEEALRQSEEQVRLLLESTAEAMYGADVNGSCTFCNPACARLLGLQDPRDLLGRNTHRMAHHSRPDGTPYPVEECPIYQAFREGRGTHVKGEVFWRADGTSFPVEYWSYPIQRGGQVLGCVVTFLEISEQIQRERELVVAKQAAEQAAQAVSDRLENVQRQLRGTLDAIVTTAERLLNTELSAGQRGYVTEMERVANGLLGLT
jgi:PAS domain S-box-containing protein